MELKKFTQQCTVTTEMTALQIGSGWLPVFSTPSLVALMENTAMQLIALSQGESSVGVSIDVKHVKGSAVGEVITCEAVLTGADGRKYDFYLTARDSSGDTVGEGKHQRVVINVEKFMGKLQQRSI